MGRQQETGDIHPAASSLTVFERRSLTKLPEGVMRPGGLALTGHLVDCCAFPRGARVVDIGCGTGVTVEYLREHGGLDAIGVDPSAMLLQQGRQRSPDLHLVRAAGEDLPFAAASVNGILAECSLSVMPDTGKVLDEMNRVLVPGGKLALTDIYIREQAASQDRPERTAGALTRDELAGMLAESGFNVIVWEECSALLKEFVARYIMENGAVEELWHCPSTGGNGGPLRRRDGKKVKLGYFLLVAEKLHAVRT
ncbi:methyltransferase type 11 [Lucifera butyrica]|uniref:Methyltransferase type 11 n=2 Tax=Lucifera butyrica TaxID=1351585 RepID=A0A498RBG6_9FIRM|nr:methyltransferase type 11 [Lucifera butyrica]VBB08801.1 methyltransferase type 11 [Lucifera butyrica]